MTTVLGLIQNKNKNYEDIAISEKGVIVTNQKNIANKLNGCFVNAVKKLVHKIGETSNKL